MGIDLEPGQPCYEARTRNCTCAWLRGFEAPEDGDPQDLRWVEKIIWKDPDCRDPEHQVLKVKRQRGVKK